MVDDTRPHPRGVPERDVPPQDAAKHLLAVDPADVLVDVWAAFVRVARRHRAMSQQALARAAGVSQQTISKTEAGEICPHDRLKVRLAGALDVPTAALFPWPSHVVLTPLHRGLAETGASDV